MPSRKKRIPDLIASRKWKIRLPKRVNGRGYYEDDISSTSTYEEACQLLVQLGFDHLTEINGNAFEPASGLSKKSRSFSIWTHPAGVFIRMNSFEERLNSMALEMEFNCGYGKENFRKAGAVSGSGGSYVNMDGTSAWDRDFSVAGFTTTSFLRVLHEVQASSHIVPMENWQRKNQSKQGVYLPVEHYFSFHPDEQDVKLSEEALLEKYATPIRQAQNALIASAPDYAKAMLERAFVGEEKLPTPLNKQDWARAENALILYGEVMSAAKIDWPTQEQSQLLSTWSNLVLSPEKPIDLVADRAEESGPAGLSFAHALMMCMHHEGNKERLLDLLDKADKETVLQWSKAPDGSGNTLMSHALAWLGSYRHAAGQEILKRALQAENVIEIAAKLVDRVGADNVVLSPPGNAALTALLDLIEDPARTPCGPPVESALVQLEKQVALLEAAHELGVSFVDAADPLQIQAMEKLREHSRLWPGISSLLSLLDREVLHSQMPHAQAKMHRPRF